MAIFQYILNASSIAKHDPIHYRKIHKWTKQAAIMQLISWSLYPNLQTPFKSVRNFQNIPADVANTMLIYTACPLTWHPAHGTGHLLDTQTVNSTAMPSKLWEAKGDPSIIRLDGKVFIFNINVRHFNIKISVLLRPRVLTMPFLH